MVSSSTRGTIPRNGMECNGMGQWKEVLFGVAVQRYFFKRLPTWAQKGLSTLSLEVEHIAISGRVRDADDSRE